VALYYKKYNLTKLYKSFLDASKQIFQANGSIKDFDKEVIPNKTLILDKDKHLQLEKLEVTDFLYNTEK